jgi:hypothetical protein
MSRDRLSVVAVNPSPRLGMRLERSSEDMLALNHNPSTVTMVDGHTAGSSALTVVRGFSLGGAFMLLA